MRISLTFDAASVDNRTVLRTMLLIRYWTRCDIFRVPDKRKMHSAIYNFVTLKSHKMSVLIIEKNDLPQYEKKKNNFLIK